MALLEVLNLEVAVSVEGRLHPVVHDISFEVHEHETLGIVGESGSGKSLASLAIMGLLDGTPIRVTGGSIRFDGLDLFSLSPRERRTVMGSRMSMIFQEPMTSLNPVYRIGDQLAEMILQHCPLSRREAWNQSIELLDLVRIEEPTVRINFYPHQLSGGQRQRVMIAIALACDPKMLIADEPTTALDVTVQKEILNLLRDLQERAGTAIILISHDLGVIAEICDRVAVMYRGKLVEQSETAQLFQNMNHPYTLGLFGSIPPANRDVEWLDAISGRVPRIDEVIDGCAFHPRCPYADEPCRTTDPEITTVACNHLVRCHFPQGRSS